jgi:predicted dehydrogenase
MSKRSLVIGMGIGQLYKTVLEKLGHEVVTVDPDISKGANFPDIRPALLVHNWFDTVHICTPNFTHKSIAEQVAPYARIIFIEKPGVKDSAEWTDLVMKRPFTRFMMVKNNMWRSNINELKELASKSKSIDIYWIRKNCIPHPGSWFTTKELAFGGVSRDLMPHLLSLYVAMNPKWRAGIVTGKQALRLSTLESIDSTEYGTVNPNGTYDVDDCCHMLFGNKWTLLAEWRNMREDDSSIKFTMEDGSVERFELGWCPEEAYHNMIVDALTNVDNHEFWANQIAIDSWIHESIEKL